MLQCILYYSVYFFGDFMKSRDDFLLVEDVKEMSLGAVNKSAVENGRIIKEIFGGSFDILPGAAYVYVGGDTNDPHKVHEAITAEAERLVREGVDEAFYQPDFVVVGNAAELRAAVEQGGYVTLSADVTIDTHLNITKDLILDLNGKTITAAKDGAEVDAIWVRDNAEVVITGNGTVAGTYDALFATGSSKLTVENGTFVGAAEAVFAQANAQVVINGGSFKSTEYPAFTLNLKDTARNTASILVNGGSFYQFNPADNKAEGEGTNFVAAGKTVEQDGEWYVVK